MSKGREYAADVSAFGRRPLLIVVAVLVLVLAGYELLPSDERRITSLLNDLCAKLNQTHDEATLTDLKQALRAGMLPNVSLRIAELELELSGVDAIVERARGMLESGVPLSFALNSLEVHSSGRLARVDVDLLVTTRGSGEQSRDLRHTHVRLAKPAAEWRIEAIDIDPVASSEPEARP
jgi:ketosteroid isomerase-like protein